LRADRRPVLPGGFAIMSAIFKMLEIKTMSISDGALREGVLHDLLERQGNRDVRDHSVAQFQRRYLADPLQAGRVSTLALELFEHLQGEDGGRELAHHLNIAAQLHEVGLSISHVNYRRHSAYILQYADIPGFSRREQERLARLVLSHRGKLTRSVLDEFSKEERSALACLRLAVLFNRARQDDAPPISHFARNNGHYTLEIAEGWLQARPLTQHVLNEEMRLWQDIGIQLKLVQRAD